MRRPAAACAAGFTAGIAAYDIAGTFLFTALSAGFLLFYLTLKCKKIEEIEISSNIDAEMIYRAASVQSGVFRRALFLFLVFFIAGGMRCAVFFADSSDFLDCAGESGYISGRVISAEEKEEKLVLVIRTCSGGGLFGEKLLVTVKQGDEAASASEDTPHNFTGWQIRVTGVFSEPKSAGNPKAFDYKRYLESRGIRMTMYADSGGLSAEKEPEGIYSLLAGLASVKDIYIGAVSKYMSEREDVYKRQLYMW